MRAWIFFAIFLPHLIMAEEPIAAIDRKASAYWQAHDYAEASALYTQLLARQLFAWQRARVLYNLGETRLAQHQDEEALAYFEQIDPIDLSIPRLGRDLLLNEAIAHLEQGSVAQQPLLIAQSLVLLSKARQLDCPEGKCRPHLLIKQWTDKARFELEAIRQKERNAWLKESSLQKIATLIRNQLLSIKEQFNKAYLPYFNGQMQALASLWEAAQAKAMTQEQKEALTQAMQNLKGDIDHREQVIEDLAPLTFASPSMRDLLLRYELLLLEDTLSFSAIHALQEESEQLDTEKSVQNYLKESLQALQAQHQLLARYYLLAAGTVLDQLNVHPSEDPAAILKQAIKQANRSMQLTFLSALIQEDQGSPPIPSTPLKTQQNDLFQQASLFIPAVLQFEKEHYQQPNPSSPRCQDTPWDQVIPLYDRGYQAAQAANTGLFAEKTNPQAVMVLQMQTLHNWEEALKLILQPPSKKGGGEAASSQDLRETFRLIQEMYLQDQSKPYHETNQEIHSW